MFHIGGWRFHIGDLKKVQNLREMERLPPGGLPDLLPATETIGNDERFIRRGSHPR